MLDGAFSLVSSPVALLPFINKKDEHGVAVFPKIVVAPSNYAYAKFHVLQFEDYHARREFMEIYRQNEEVTGCVGDEVYQIKCRIRHPKEFADRTREIRSMAQFLFSSLKNKIDVGNEIRSIHSESTLCLHHKPIAYFVDGENEMRIEKFREITRQWCKN